jgi:hypothetical protein
MAGRTLSPEERVARVRHEVAGLQAAAVRRAAVRRLAAMEHLLAQGALQPIDDDVDALLDAIMAGREPDAAIKALDALGRRALWPTLETWEHREIRNVRAHPQDVDQNLNAVLVAIGEPAVEPLLTYLHRPTGPKHQAAWVLGLLGDRRAVEPLVAALDDSDPVVRWAAAHALAWPREPGAVDGLARRLNDRSDMVRLAAIEALAGIGDARAISPLRRFIQTRSPRYRTRRAGVVDAARRVLAALGDDTQPADERTSTG